MIVNYGVYRIWCSQYVWLLRKLSSIFAGWNFLLKKIRVIFDKESWKNEMNELMPCDVGRHARHPADRVNAITVVTLPRNKCPTDCWNLNSHPLQTSPIHIDIYNLYTCLKIKNKMTKNKKSKRSAHGISFSVISSSFDRAKWTQGLW